MYWYMCNVLILLHSKYLKTTISSKLRSIKMCLDAGLSTCLVDATNVVPHGNEMPDRRSSQLSLSQRLAAVIKLLLTRGRKLPQRVIALM